MTELNGTPGPWHWRSEGEGWYQEWYLDPGIMIAYGGDGTPGGDEIDRANAHLIAAAPDLYEALAAFQSNAVIRSVCPSPLWAEMVDALAKARGKA